MYLKLVSVFFKESFSLKRLFGVSFKQSKIKIISISILLLYSVTVLMGSFGYMFFDLSKMMNEADQLSIIIGFSASYTLGLAVMMSLLRSSGYVFHYKDYDILAPLPIKDTTVLFAKLTVMLLLLYITSVLFVAPIAFGYFYFRSFSIIAIIYFIIGFLVTPLIPIVLMSFVSLLLNIITKRLPFSKLLNIILMFALFIGIFIVSFSFGAVESNPLTGQVDMVDGLSRFYLPISFFINGVHELNHLEFLLYVILNIGVFVGYVFLIEKLVRKTNQSKQKQYFSRRKKATYQTKPLWLTLVIKEAKKFFSIPIYVVNSGLGVVIMFALGAASIFFSADIEPLLVSFSSLNISVLPILFIVFGFCIVMTYTTSVSLSLEGKQLWVIKSLPIEPFYVMISKVIFNLILLIPVGVLSGLILTFTLKLSLAESAVLIFGIVSLSVLSSLVGSYINLLLPKFEFNSEVEVIKQSIASFVAIFGGYGILISLGFMYYGLSSYLDDILNFTVLILFINLLSVLLVVFLKGFSRKQFLKY